jgi:hypothetical protein
MSVATSQFALVSWQVLFLSPYHEVRNKHPIPIVQVPQCFQEYFLNLLVETMMFHIATLAFLSSRRHLSKIFYHYQ